MPAAASNRASRENTASKRRLEARLSRRGRNDIPHRRDRLRGLILIHIPKHRTHRRCGVQRVRRGSDRERHVSRKERLRHLGIRLVDRRIGRLRQALLPDVIHNSDDRQPVSCTRMIFHGDSLADRVRAAPQLPRDGLADDHNARRVRSIAIRKVPAEPQTNPNCAEITGTDNRLVYHVIRRQVTAVFNLKGPSDESLAET